MLELKNISFLAENDEGKKEIIHNVSLRLDERFVALTGPNGGGKSTLAKIIAGIYTPTDGQIIFDGVDITDKNITERAKMGISFGFQQPVRFKGITVRDLINLATGKKLSVAQICDYLSDVGLCAREYINREVNASLSGGELKRIEIAMVMARGTKLTIFDEPEAGIDLWSFSNLISVFEKMYEKKGGTILIISHQERILNIADRIIVIANGESAGVVSLGEVAGSVITVPAYTTMILVDKESFDDVAVTSGKGKVIVNYVIKDSEQKLRESITLQGTSGTNYAVPENIKIPSGYTFLSKTGDEKGVYTSETQTVTYYYNAINPDTVVDGIKNNGVYCEKAQFKVTSSDYTQVMAGNKTLTPDADGIYTVSAADGTQIITLTDNEGYSIYLSVTVNANHTIDNSDCTKESICSVCGKIFLAQANHKFSDTWTKDDTYHWKVCENDGCTVTTTKTKHSGTDDGDCTTPVICECGEIVTAAKSEHIYGEWKSNGNGTHTHKCTTAGCTIEETESCVGGAATCKKRAVCTECNAEYGTLNPANHSGEQVWVQTEKTHQKKYDCCGAEVTNIADHIWENGHCTVCGYDCIHTGGKATCTQKAVCNICHSEYGEINADNHTGTEKWTQTATTHEKKYDCCGKVTIEQENHKWKDGVCETCGYVCVHSGGEATCTKGAVCETCGKEYTDKDMANHSGKLVWVQTEKTHKQAYDCCDKEVSTSEAHGWKNGVCTVCDYQCKHAGGSATCVKKAVCTICGEEYGTYNMSMHEDLQSVAAKAATRTDEGNIEYWYCKDCDRYYIRQDGLVEIEKSQTVVAKITDTTSLADTCKDDNTETVKEQAPDTGDNKHVFVWLLMFVIGGAAAGLTVKGKKPEN